MMRPAPARRAASTARSSKVSTWILTPVCSAIGAVTVSSSLTRVVGVDQRFLAMMGADAQDELVHEPRRSRNNVEMTVGYGIEAAGIKACARHGQGIARSRSCRNLSGGGSSLGFHKCEDFFMASDNPSIISHVSVGTNRYDEARAFYDESAGHARLQDHHGASGRHRLRQAVS